MCILRSVEDNGASSTSPSKLSDVERRNLQSLFSQSQEATPARKPTGFSPVPQVTMGSAPGDLMTFDESFDDIPLKGGGERTQFFEIGMGDPNYYHMYSSKETEQATPNQSPEISWHERKRKPTPKSTDLLFLAAGVEVDDNSMGETASVSVECSKTTERAGSKLILDHNFSESEDDSPKKDPISPPKKSKKRVAKGPLLKGGSREKKRSRSPRERGGLRGGEQGQLSGSSSLLLPYCRPDGSLKLSSSSVE